MVSRIMVTGGCGFIGANLIPKIIDSGYSIRVLDNLSRGHRSYLNGLDVDFVEVDIRDPVLVASAMEEIDAVIHLAAYGSVVESVEDPMTNFEINGRGTLNILEAARKSKVSKVVFASTGGALIGDVEPPVNEDSAPRPKSPYGASKLLGEGYCSAFAGSYGLSTVMLRFGNVYGPISAHKKGAITAFCKNLLRKEPFVIYGDGSASRDFLHVSDLCDGILRALKADLNGATVLHLATGRETSIKTLAQTVTRVAGVSNHKIIYKPARIGEVHRNFANYNRARDVLGYVPKISLEDGLKQTWEWFETQGEAVFEVDATDS